MMIARCCETPSGRQDVSRSMCYRTFSGHRRVWQHTYRNVILLCEMRTHFLLLFMLDRNTPKLDASSLARFSDV